MIDWKKYIPPMLSGDELKKALYDLPEYKEEIRDEDASTRLLALSDLYKVYIPQSMSAEIYIKLYKAMMNSLQKKDTKEATQQRKEIFISKSQFRGIIGGSDSFTIIGKSGIGKSAAIDRAISIISRNQIIEINAPCLKIIPILQVQTPFDCSAKSLLLEILRSVDERIGSNYYRSGTRAGVTTDVLIGLVSTTCLTHICVLIVDEIQNVVGSRKGGWLVGMLMQLINSSGISICMVGTPESQQFFDSQMQLARRSLGLHYYPLKNDSTFYSFCKEILLYQYTKYMTEVNDEIIDWLYEYSQGNVSIVVTLIHDAQEIAIINGIETLSIVTLEMAYKERLGMLHDRIAIEKKIGAQTSVKQIAAPLLPVKKNIDLSNAKTIAEIVLLCRENCLDVVTELSKVFTVEAVAI